MRVENLNGLWITARPVETDDGRELVTILCEIIPSPDEPARQLAITVSRRRATLLIARIAEVISEFPK